MDTPITAPLTTAILAEAAGRYGAQPAHATLLQASASDVFAVTVDGTPRILRLTHSSRRSAAQLDAELQFIDYLGHHGLGVAHALTSPAGRRIETVSTAGGAFHAVLFERAAGAAMVDGAWTGPLIQAWGQFLGRLHALSRRYRPEAPVAPRPHWDDAFFLRPVGRVLPDQPRVLDRLAALREDLRALPRDGRSYGLIHADLETENFFVRQGRLVAFDFDDLAHGWYAYDVAVILRQATWGLTPGRAATPTELADFTRHFMNGYERETHLGDFWLQEMPLLLKLRELVSYVHFHISRDLTPPNSMTQSIGQMMRRRIEEGVPVITFDLTQI